MSRAKYLILRPDKAGDAIKSLPALRALRDLGPEGEYHILASQDNSSLFVFEPNYFVHTLPKKWEDASPKDLEKILEKLGLGIVFEKAVSLPCDPFPQNERLLAIIKAARKYSTGWEIGIPLGEWEKITLPDNTPAKRDESTNIALLLNKTFDVDLTAQLSNVSRAPLLSELDHEEAEKALGERRGERLGLCPFAGLQNRTHPFSHWRKFLKKVTKENSYKEIFLFGAWGDKEKLEALRGAASPSSLVKIFFPTTFRTLGAYLARMDAVVAVDSGPLHFAQALGVPSLGILSGGDSVRWFARMGEKDRLLERGLFNRYPMAWEMFRAFLRFQTMSRCSAGSLKTL
jgi:ADP-heptose:LPS heptosyltransferase